MWSLKKRTICPWNNNRKTNRQRDIELNRPADTQATLHRLKENPKHRQTDIHTKRNTGGYGPNAKSDMIF